MSVSYTRLAKEDTIEFIKSIPEKKSAIDKAVFGYDRQHLLRTANGFFISIENDTINGIIVIKNFTLEKRPYTDVTLCYAKDPKIYDELVSALVARDRTVNSDGIFTEMLNDNDESRSAAFIKHGVKKYESVYSIRKDDLLAKVDKNISLRHVLFSKRTRSDLTEVFTKFLLEYDTLLAVTRNKTLGHPLYPTSIKKSRTHQIRVSYFISGVLKSKEWTAFILFDNEQPIGFVKGKVVKGTNVCYPEIYLLPKYIEKYREPALSILLQYLRVEFIGFISNDHDSEYKKMYESLAGKSVGHSYAKV